MTIFSARFEAITASPVVMVADISVIRFIFINLESLRLLCEQAGWLCGNLFFASRLRVFPVLVIAHVLFELGLVQSVLPDMLIGSRIIVFTSQP